MASGSIPHGDIGVTQEADNRLRLQDAIYLRRRPRGLEATLEREIQVEKILRSKLDFAQMKIRLAQQERARRRGVDLTKVADYS